MSLDQLLIISLQLAAEEIAAAALSKEDTEDIAPDNCQFTISSNLDHDANSNSDDNSSDGSSSDSASGSSSGSESSSNSDGASDNLYLPARESPKMKKQAKKTKTTRCKAGQSGAKKPVAAQTKKLSKENVAPALHGGKKSSKGNTAPVLRRVKKSLKGDIAPALCGALKVSTYEQEKEENIVQNQAMLAALGLPGDVEQLIQAGNANPTTSSQQKWKHSVAPPADSAHKSSCPSAGKGNLITASGNLITASNVNVNTTGLHTDNDMQQPALHADDNTHSQAQPQSVTASPQVPNVNSIAMPLATVTSATPDVDMSLPEVLGETQDLDKTLSQPQLNAAAELEPPTSTPNWLWKPLEEISKVPLNANFNTTLHLFYQLEGQYSFVSKTRGYPKEHHPQLLNDWVTNGHGQSFTPIVYAVSPFSKGWWTWWMSLQPQWWSSVQPLARLEDQSDWGKLYTPGANGILGIITCLYWWGKSTLGKVEEGVVQDAGNIEECKEAVEDVQWTLQALVDHY